MEYCNESEFWWSDITGANMVVTNVVRSLSQNSNVILNVPEDLPWRYEMRSSIELLFRKIMKLEELTIIIIDAKDDCADIMPGSFLLDKFGRSREIKMGYRKGSNQTIQQYLINNNVLKNTVFWIKGFDKNQEVQWIEFINGFDSNSVENGLFLLEVHNMKRTFINKGAFIDFSDTVSKYDVQLFISFVLEETRNLSFPWKKYISCVSANLCETDAEIAVELIKNTNFKSENPFEGIKKIVESGNYNSRGAESGSKHILALYRNDNFNELKHRLWLSQLQILFPLIELERVNIINKYCYEIKKAINQYTISQYEKVLISPDEIELGTLDFHVKQCHIFINDVETREWISFLHSSRNCIAHMECLDPVSVTKIIENISQV